MAKYMTLIEVEQCDSAFLVIADDPECFEFKRVKTTNEFIHFSRKMMPNVTDQPHLWKEYYGITWFAYDGKPCDAQIMICRRRYMKNAEIV